MDPQSKVVGLTANSIDPNTNQFFTISTDVTDLNGYLYLTAQTFTTPVSGNFYFVVKLPPYLQVQNNQIAPTGFFDCSSLSFLWCITMPEINYVVVNSIANGSIFKPYITNNPMSISLSNSYFYNDVWADRRYVGTVTYDISPTRWLEIQGVMAFTSVTVIGKVDKLTMNRKNCEIMVQFTTLNPININGTIEIRFPATITGIRSHCRSAVAAGSKLYSQGGAYGEIGCMLQSGRSWVITGFQALAAGSVVIISGKIDIPNTSGSIGIGEIISYSDMHDTDIYTNGSRIDYVSTDFGLTVSTTPAFNADPLITMYETLPLRVNFVGSLRLIIQLPQDFQPSNVGSMQFRLSKKSILSQSGGFAYDSSKKVCEFMDILTGEKLGCIVSDVTDDTLSGYENVRYTLIASQTLLASKQYLMTLTSQKGIQPEGIYFPSIAGTYKIDANFDVAGLGTYPIHTHSYL